MRFIMVMSSILLICASLLSGDTASYKKRELTPSAEKSIAEIKKSDSIKKECYNKYGGEIDGKTKDLRIQLQGYFHQEREILKQKCANDSELVRIKLEIQCAIKDTAQHNAAEKSAHLLSLKRERDSLERKAQDDPEVVVIRRNFARTKELIDQIIRAIIKNDSVCISCMGIGASP